MVVAVLLLLVVLVDKQALTLVEFYLFSNFSSGSWVEVA
jgi:hypothetical protein